MTRGSFPSEPSRRKAILVLRDHDIEKCDYEPGAAQALFDEEAHVLSFPVILPRNAPVVLRNIVDLGLARPGNMLVQSPYDADTYEEAALAPQRFALEKHMYFSTLCKLLGANEVVVDQIDLRTGSGRSTWKVNAERLGVGGQAAVAQENLESFREQIHLFDEFAGGPPDVEAAERHLRRTGLWAEHNMRTLIEMRRDGANQLKTRKLVLNLSSEAKSNLNVVGRLKIPAFVKLSAEYKRVVKERQDYTLTLTVKF